MSDRLFEQDVSATSFRRPMDEETIARLRGATRRPTSSVVMPAKASRDANKNVPARSDYMSVKASLRDQLLAELGERELLGAPDEEVAEAVQAFSSRIIEDGEIALNQAERSRLAEELREETTGMGPLAPLMLDPAVTDILVNGPDCIYVERFGRLERTEVRFRDAEAVVRLIERLAAQVGRRVDTSSPMVDLRLADGSRVNATLSAVTLDGPTVSIRRFGRRRLRREDLMHRGMMSPEMMQFLEIAVRRRKNLLVCGGTGAGKSTLLGALAEAIPAAERVITIEDTAELVLDQEHVIRMETRPPNIEGRGRIIARDLVINALRMRPDRIMIGEVRGAEALDMMQAMNTGHDGSMSTIHANSPRDALSRLETMALMGGVELPARAIREQIVSAIQLLVYVRRFEDGVRRIEMISELSGMESTTPLMQDVFVFKRTGMQGKNVIGNFQATGVVPRIALDLREQGIEVPLEIFQPPLSRVTGGPLAG